MRIVLDTNVFVSGIFFTGPPHRIVRAWGHGRLQLVTSLEIIAEYNEVALRLSRRYKNIDILPFIELAATMSEIVRADPLPEPVCDDPSDDMFLSCALAGQVPVIVSGDRHLLKASGYQGIKVLRPKPFADVYL